MAQNQFNQLEYEAPIFSFIVVKNFIVVSCGGGGKNVGIKNKISSFKYAYPFKALTHKICDIDTESELIINLISNPLENLILGSSDQNCIAFSLNSQGNLQQIYIFQTDFKIKDPYQVKKKNYQILKQNITKFNSQGNLIATGGDDGIIRIWAVDYQNGNFSVQQCNEIISHSNAILSFDFHPQENILASVALDQLCVITDLKQMKQIKKLSITDEIEKENWKFSHCLFYFLLFLFSERFSTNGEFLYTLQNVFRGDSYLTKWNAFNNFLPILNVKICFNAISAVKINQKFLAFGSNEGLAVIYNLKSDQIVQKKMLHDMIIKSIDFTKDGKYLISGSGDLTYNIYGIKNKNSLLSILLNQLKFLIILVLLLLLNKLI